MHRYSLVPVGMFVVALAALGCSNSAATRVEGTEPGDCTDGADNDGDGAFDCVDTGCTGAPACGAGVDAGDAGGADDAGGAFDGAAADAGSDAGVVERRTYVANALELPRDATAAARLGRDLDGDGTVDNQLGNVIAAFQAAGGSGSVDVQGAMDQSVARGDVILLVEAVAPSFVTTTSAAARMLRGEMPMPAPCTDATDTFCRRHLAGSGSFVVTLPAPEFAHGPIVANRLDAGPSTTAIPFALFGETPSWVPLIAARMSGSLTASEIIEGTIAGAIREADLNAIVIPGLHTSVAARIGEDCPSGTCTPGSTGETLLALFDDNSDGTVPLDELRMNSLIATLLRPDVDLLDASGSPGTDGTPDALSVGVGFQAVLGSFAEP